MEFWGTEVAPGDPKVCQPGDEMYCHVSQAALGPSTGGKSERVVLRVETGGKDVVLGTLSTGKCDQMALDLIFDREFKLSHTGSSCSVYFCGYKTEKGEPEEFDSEEDEDEEESEEEEAPDAVPMKANGDAKPISGGKALADAVKKTVKSPVKPQLVDDEAEEGEDSDEDDDDDEEEFTQMNSTVMDIGSDDSDEEDDSEFEDDEDDDSDLEDSDEFDEDEDDSDESDESEEEMATPEVGKKRPSKEGNAKTPTSGKKARVDTPRQIEVRGIEVVFPDFTRVNYENRRGGLIDDSIVANLLHTGSLTAAEYWESLIVAGRKVVSPGKKSDKAASKVAAASTPAKATPVSGGKKAKDGKDVKEGKDQKTPQKSPGKEGPAKTPKSGIKTPGGKAETTPGSAKKGFGPHKCEPCNRSFATEAAATQHMSAKHGTPASGK